MKIAAILLAAGVAGVTTNGIAFAQLAPQPDQSDGSQVSAPPPESVDAEIMQQARNRFSAPGSATRSAAVHAKSETVVDDMHDKAAILAAKTANATAAQMRERFAGNAQIAEKEKRPCADPPANPPTDGSALCTPGSHEN